MPKDTQSRKWLLTINNPLEHNLSHDEIKNNIAMCLTTVEYWCMCDELGLEEQTPHTHVFMYSSSAIRFITLKKIFAVAHIDCCKGTCQQNLDYIKKEGKYKNDEKTKTNLADTFESFGEMPIERAGARNDITDLYDMIYSGMSNAEILDNSPQYLLQIDKIEKVRQTVQEEKWRTVWRNIETTYIFGATGSGKTRTIMEKYGYENVYRVTDYDHPFDGYMCQDVLMFEEFRSSCKRISDMLNFLDGYPLSLPCRFQNKQACYTKVFIVSNIDLTEQYKTIQSEQPETWKAFVRRIHNVEVFGNGFSDKYTTDNYIRGFRYLSAKDGDLPF